jgi:S-adenosylmethionine decarboxylase
MKLTMGIHILADLHGCPPDLLERADVVAKLLNEVVSDTNLTKLGENHHQFEPYGVTSIILLAESHISIHTWPEQDGSAAVDIFTCGDPENADRAFESLKAKFKPTRVTAQKIHR